MNNKKTKYIIKSIIIIVMLCSIVLFAFCCSKKEDKKDNNNAINDIDFDSIIIHKADYINSDEDFDINVPQEIEPEIVISDTNIVKVEKKSETKTKKYYTLKRLNIGEAKITIKGKNKQVDYEVRVLNKLNTYKFDNNNLTVIDETISLDGLKNTEINIAVGLEAASNFNDIKISINNDEYDFNQKNNKYIDISEITPTADANNFGVKDSLLKFYNIKYLNLGNVDLKFYSKYSNSKEKNFYIVSDSIKHNIIPAKYINETEDFAFSIIKGVIPKITIDQNTIIQLEEATNKIVDNEDGTVSYNYKLSFLKEGQANLSIKAENYKDLNINLNSVNPLTINVPSEIQNGEIHYNDRIVFEQYLNLIDENGLVTQNVLDTNKEIIWTCDQADKVRFEVSDDDFSKVVTTIQGEGELNLKAVYSKYPVFPFEYKIKNVAKLSNYLFDLYETDSKSSKVATVKVENAKLTVETFANDMKKLADNIKIEVHNINFGQALLTKDLTKNQAITNKTTDSCDLANGYILNITCKKEQLETNGNVSLKKNFIKQSSDSVKFGYIFDEAEGILYNYQEGQWYAIGYNTGSTSYRQGLYTIYANAVETANLGWGYDNPSERIRILDENGQEVYSCDGAKYLKSQVFNLNNGSIVDFMVEKHATKDYCNMIYNYKSQAPYSGIFKLHNYEWINIEKVE